VGLELRDLGRRDQEAPVGEGSFGVYSLDVHSLDQREQIVDQRAGIHSFYPIHKPSA